MKPTLRRLAADVLTSSPARFAALALDVLIYAAERAAARLGRRNEL